MSTPAAIPWIQYDELVVAENEPNGEADVANRPAKFFISQSDFDETGQFPGFMVRHLGTASPEGVLTANPGISYVDLTNQAFYIKMSGAGNTGWVAVGGNLSGNGSPEGVVTANIGQLYEQRDGTSTEYPLWIKRTGSATNTGWRNFQGFIAGTGPNSLHAGDSSVASGDNGLAAGNTATAAGTGAIAFGTGVNAGGNGCIAMGDGASSGTGADNIAIGTGAIASTTGGTNNIVIGTSNNDNTTASSCVLIGANITKSATQSAVTIIGSGATNTGAGVSINGACTATGSAVQVCIQGTTGATSASCVNLLGSVTSAATVASVAIIGTCSNVSTIAIGNGAAASGAGGVSVGAGNSAASASQAVALGFGAQASGSNAIAIGAQSAPSATDTVAIGQGVTVTGASSIGIRGSIATATSAFCVLGAISNASTAAVVIGLSSAAGSSAASARAVMIGNACITTSVADAFALGGSITVSAALSLGIGKSFTIPSTGTNTCVIGWSHTLTGLGANSVIIGNNCTSGTNGGNVVIGNGASANGGSGVAISGSITAGGSATSVAILGTCSGSCQNSVAVGATSVSTANSSIAIGSAASANSAGAIMIGTGTINATGSGIAIGSGANIAAAHVNCIVIGAATTWQSQMCTIGLQVSLAPTNMYCFGNGTDTSGTVSSILYRQTNSSGSNIAGSDHTVQPGLATGNAASGLFKVQTGSVTTSGTTLQTAAVRFVVGTTSAFHTAVSSNHGLDVRTPSTVSTALGTTLNVQGTITAAANSDVMAAIRVAPTFTIGGFTSTYGIGLDIATVSGAGLNFAIRSVPNRAVFGQTVHNVNSSAGLTWNQGGDDDEILSFKSTDIAHGMTTRTETDTFCYMKKGNAANGGLSVEGLSADVQAVLFTCSATNGDTTKSTAARGAFLVNGAKKSGTTVTTMGANENIAVFMSAGTTRFILDADGDSHQDVGTAWTNFDEHDDIRLLNTLAAHLTRESDPLRRGFARWLGESRSQMEKLRLATFNDDGHHFVNMSRLTMLHTGALRQVGARLERIETMLQKLLPAEA